MDVRADRGAEIGTEIVKMNRYIDSDWERYGR